QSILGDRHFVDAVIEKVVIPNKEWCTSTDNNKYVKDALVQSYMESTELPLLKNIRKMHSACKSRPGISLSVLVLMSQVYTIEQLKDFRFEFSSNQYSLSWKKASDGNFTLVDYERHSPTSKTKVSDETKAKVKPEKRTGVCDMCATADYKENFKIGGGPIETTRDFYQKSQISNFCFRVLSKSGDLVQRRYYNYLSENLSHDSLYVINCLKDLLYRSEFQEFEEVNLWSDSGPHFKNADYLYSACLELPQISPSKKFKLNYFMENHDKSDVDGHFRVLSRLFKEIERNMHLSSIEDLIFALREKAKVPENIPDNSWVYHFQIYRKDAIRSLKIRAKVSSGFRKYLSFYLGDVGLMTCPLNLPDPSKYFNIDLRANVKRDIRTKKYAPDRSNPLGSDTDIMGSTSRNTQRIRVEMLIGIEVSLII
ncbi:hypothetical protein BB560_006707, partial [Smittium megazygosporum]